MKTNYEMFIETVRSLRNSQGFYSRIAKQLDEMSKEERQQVKEQLNSMEEKFTKPIDVILFLEQ